jgi:hypothetical protein
VSAFIRAYDTTGNNLSILLRVDKIITLFSRFRAANRDDARTSKRRAGYTVEATIHTGFDGPTFSLAISDDADVAHALRDQLADAIGEGVFEDGGIWILDETEGLIPDEIGVDDDE